MPAMFAALHFLLAFTLVACAAAELALLSVPANHVRWPVLARVDALYGLSAVSLLAVGLYRAIHLEKGWAYYSHSWPFLLKLVLFATIALLSIYPTVQFVRARNGNQHIDPTVVGRIKFILRIQLILAALLIVCASLAARGAGVVI